MNDYENPHVHPQEDAHYEVISNPGYSAQADASAYRADASSEYGYAAASKTKDTKRPWIITLVLILCCCILSGAMGAGGVLLMQHLQADETAPAPEQEQQQNQQGSSGNFPWGRP